jgi:hypothetical protein
MIMKPWIVVAAATVLGIAIHGLTGSSEGHAPAHTSPALGAASPRPTEVPRPTAGRRASMPLRAVPDVPGAERASSGTKRMPGSPEEMRDRLEERFLSEAVDPAWTGGATESLARGVRAVLPAGSRLTRIECRATLCRIETGHPDLNEFRTYAHAAFLDRETRVGTSGGFASLIGEPPAGAGPVAGVAYLAREGKEMPSPEALLAAR